MKNLLKLAVIFLLLFSCANNEPFEEPFIPDPTIIAEYHILGSNEEPHTKYIFDEQGRFTTFNIVDEVSISFEYDLNNRVLKFTKTDLQDNSTEIFDVSYDGDGRIATFGESTFTYHAEGNYYTDDINYQTDDFIDESDPNILYTETYFKKYTADENGIITGFCGYEIISKKYLDTNITEIEWEGCNGLHGYSIGYSENVEGYTESTTSGHEYEYDENPNPLYHSQTNLWDLRILFEDQYNYNPYGFGHGGVENLFCIISQNNVIDEGENCSSYGNACGPEGIKYTYEFNALDLPIRVRRQGYYVGEPEGAELLYAKYYYQGEIIPE